ncbi:MULTISPECIES: penicillin-binding protein [Mammaliicoccus]|uniref:Penicillin-binding protein n=1 Tax=Mammaliicoccus fleurettii TaxID=150056 RepID=A0ABS5MJZ0_9STAP|nr:MULTISPECIES: penicillin-binding transpeptidase domain-containing protein [Mammaliicoccus]MBL0846494.1 penicillin-binding protein [Mammaliicoccus fleurettii]MBO3062908.1 penicillin-binding protein [Mammaliicoccus fleurettii]MBS3670935.1 penicillin-binding protein [Mammaliicoccus fleurettii]MBS3695994.1 penicillin-binding protein [Mammaliicoccus fleurettii]MEB6201603.1 penicillin-binding protein [Mammaliicoccus fleurettii]
MPKIKIKKNKIGAVLLVSFFGLLFFILALRYSYLMISGHSAGEDLAYRASEKYLRQSVAEPERGKIYDRNGKVLAEDTDSYKLVAILDKKMSKDSDKPLHVKDKKKTAKELSKIIDMDEKDILKKLETKKAFQVEFGQKGKDLTYKQKTQIEKLKLPGLTFETEKKRFYPNGNFASHLIGLADKDHETNKLKGVSGAEKVFDSYLSGKTGKNSYKQDIWGMLVPNSEDSIKAKNGDDVHLTLDSNIQVFVENSLDEMVDRYKPKDLFAVVMDAKTGEILGYSQRPTFNPDTKEDFGKKWANDLYQNTYEPGSTFKTYGLAAAIEEGKFDPKKKFKSGNREIDGFKIYDWNDDGWGNIPMTTGFTYSANTLMMKLQDLVGEDKSKAYYEKFGFGKKTGGLFDSEAPGHIAFDNELQRKTSAFGQSTTVTPVQMLQAETAILNQGNMLEPYYVKSIENREENKTIKKGEKKVVGNPVSKDTAQKTMDELDKVVNSKESHATNYQIDGYRVAGKTGTAQVPDTKGGGYVDGANPYFVSFMGYAPAKDPEVVVYAGMSLAQKRDLEAYEYGVSRGFNPIMENTLKYLDVEETEGKAKNNSSEVPDVVNMNVQKATDAIKGKKLDPILIGKGDKVKKQLPLKGKNVQDKERILLVTDGEMTMPNTENWTKRDLLKLQEATGIDVETEGSGYVSEQSIDENQTIKAGTKVTFTLSNNHPNGDNSIGQVPEEDTSKDKNKDNDN